MRSRTRVLPVTIGAANARSVNFGSGLVQASAAPRGYGRLGVLLPPNGCTANNGKRQCAVGPIGAV